SHNVSDICGVYSVEVYRVAILRVKADDGVVATTCALLNQGAVGSGRDQVVTGPAVDRIWSKAALYGVVAAAAVNDVGSEAAVYRGVVMTAVNRVRAEAAVYGVIAVAAGCEVRTCPDCP